MSVNDFNGPEEWFSLEEISEHLKVSKDTVRSWIRKKTIPFHKVGRQYRFRMSEVEAWIDSGEAANADKPKKRGGQ